MGSINISLVAFAIIFGGALLGLLLRAVLPSHHLSPESKDVVKLGMGLVGTVAALVLGLLIASAKGSYDSQSNELNEMASKIVLLDRVLSHYGPETKEIRDSLHAVAVYNLENLWSNDASSRVPMEGPAVGNEVIYEKIQTLTPANPEQTSLQNQALGLIMSLAQTRWLMYAQRAASISTTLLVVLVFWLAIIFISFGLFSPRNITVVASLFFSALALSCAVLLILEMSAPYSGLIQISKGPLRAAISHLGK
ncbi:MAG: hypothetical protein K8R69_10400 [Deltaproteobacteria bacterium]|nr:hypothetical protein [Deltaproteobacteria bacterium]